MDLGKYHPFFSALGASYVPNTLFNAFIAELDHIMNLPRVPPGAS